MKRHKPFKLEGRLAKILQSMPKAASTTEYVGKFLSQLYGDDYLKAFREVGRRFNAVEIDRTRVKPIVKITGEFWAQTTEGDGNFNMFPFLEKEGAQVLVEPIGTWIMYMIHQVVQKSKDQKGLEEGAILPNWIKFWKRLPIEWNYRKKVAKLKVAERIFKREWNRLRAALGNLPHDLTDQYEMQRIGHPFYNSRAGGGEGHLEVAKNIYYSNKDLAHMVLSVKPFGCMPSTQSDGSQAAVVSQYKDMIYIPIETSGEGAVNAHSRVQMALGEAKFKAKAEFGEAVKATGYSLAEIQDYLQAHPELKKPFYHVPHIKGVVGIGASFVRHVGERMKTEGTQTRAKAA
jgi:predicted nucleotide-binding protein (sugar kinase/HSP70/actin superfamily)